MRKMASNLNAVLLTTVSDDHMEIATSMPEELAGICRLHFPIFNLEKGTLKQ